MSILAALNRLNNRLEARGAVPAPGYSTVNVDFCIVLGADGTPEGKPEDLRSTESKKRPGRPLSVPTPPKRSGKRPPPSFLWDNSKYVLGVDSDAAGTGLAPFEDRLEMFRDVHRTAFAGTNDPGLLALLGFFDFWTPDKFTELGWPRDILGANIVFALSDDWWDSQDILLHTREAAKAAWRWVSEPSGDARAMCLVTGDIAPPARLHPAIKGVWGAQSSGASLVSFNLDAFESYAKEQGANAPVSEAVAAAYGTALNHMLRGTTNRVQIGDASVVFWADTSKVGDAERLVGGLFDPLTEKDVEAKTSPDDAQESRRLFDALTLLSQGRGLQELSLDLDPETRFFVLGLSPNAARLSVRFWYESTLRELTEAHQTHWQDLTIDPPAWKSPPKHKALLIQTAVLDKWENVPPNLGGEVMRAILTGAPYPRTLLSLVIQRIRADGDIRPERVAICKAVLTRDLRIAGRDEHWIYKREVFVSLDRQNKDPAYRLGRLFAVLEGIQYRALGSVNASIRDRYFGAASATPAGVFPLLLRGSNHHLSVLRKKPDTKKLAGWFEGQIGEIVEELDMNLPSHLGLEAQGRFVVGYYHQRNDRPKAAEAEADTTPDAKPEI
jgi:CRISPR-associated protein Csd1